MGTKRQGLSLIPYYITKKVQGKVWILLFRVVSKWSIDLQTWQDVVIAFVILQNLMVKPYY